MPERPDRMFRRDRPIVPCDDGAEPLYRRFAPESMLQDGWEGVSFKFPDCSVNRGGTCHVRSRVSFGEPEDVILDCPGWGILKIVVSNIPEFVLSGDATEFPLRAEHVPWEVPGEENYAHAEIRIYKRGAAGELMHFTKDLPKVAKKEWRQIVTNHVQAKPDGVYKLPD